MLPSGVTRFHRTTFSQFFYFDRLQFFRFSVFAEKSGRVSFRFNRHEDVDIFEQTLSRMARIAAMPYCLIAS